MNPAPRKTFAYDVGIRNAKQVGGFGAGDVLRAGDVRGVGVALGFGDVVGVRDLVGDALGVLDGVGVEDEDGGGHFDDDPFVSAPSRLPKTTEPDSTARIGARYPTGSRGNAGVLPKATSPTATIVASGFADADDGATDDRAAAEPVAGVGC